MQKAKEVQWITEEEEEARHMEEEAKAKEKEKEKEKKKEKKKEKMLERVEKVGQGGLGYWTRGPPWQ